MRTEPSGRCASCGDEAVGGPHIRVAPPAWFLYLIDERNVDPPIHSLAIPLCERCSGRIDYARDFPLDVAFHEDRTPADELDDLDTEELLDWSGR